jgi:hypothetical protein
MGKSALMQHFLGEIRGDGAVEVLSGRAYARETIPYKAIDSLVDSLANVLIRMEAAQRSLRAPRHLAALTRLFPVLERVPSFAGIPQAAVQDAHRMRRQASGALRELIRMLSLERPLVLYVDNVQWGDADSVWLLHEVVRPPDPPPLLLIVTYRDDDVTKSPFLLEMEERWPATADVRDIHVGPLDLEDATALALAHLSSDDAAAKRTARAAAREAVGSPFLVEELVRSAGGRADASGQTLALVTLAEIVGERIARLPLAARKMAEIIAVAGRPLPIQTALAACGDDSIADDDVELLRSERLVQASFRQGSEMLEPSHDRVGETIVEQLPAAVLRGHHRAIARAIERAPGVDVEAMALHLLGSGDHERGAEYARRAGDQATSKLAFDHAAHMYRLALETVPRSADEARPLRVQLATALERAGHGAEAARVFLEAAEGAPGLERLDLERSAGAQLVYSGHTEEGTAVLRRVLAAVGMRTPRTALGAIVSLLLQSLLLRLRGLRFQERLPGNVLPEDRIRLDTLHTVGAAFSVVDVVWASCVHISFFRLALKAGDLADIALGLSSRFVRMATRGGTVRAGERATQALAAQLVRQVGQAHVETQYEIARGMALFQRGRWREAREVLHSRPASRRGQELVQIARLFGAYSLMHMGRLRELKWRGLALIEEARRRGDLSTVVNLRGATFVDVALADDDPRAARNHIRFCLDNWTQKGFHVQHWKAMVWGAKIHLYTGDGAGAYECFERDAEAYRRSRMAVSQLVRGLTWYYRACAAIASALVASVEVRRARLKEARWILRRLEREAMPWTSPLASVVRAAASSAAGDRASATEALRAAAASAEAADMALHAAAARHQLGCLLGGPAGHALRAGAEAAMRAEGVRIPSRVASMLVPGRWDP